MGPVLVHLALLLFAAAAPAFGQAPAAVAPGRTDYLKFAQGAVPVSIGGEGARLGANFEHAVRIIDGDTTNFTFVNRASAETATEFVYQLPASTTFDRFAVPDIRETPSPNQTFARLIEIHGSATSADSGYTLLASATLRTHARRTDITEIPPVAKEPVKWVKVRLVGGINVATPQSFFEFSDIIGNGVQEAPALVDHFRGTWLGRGVSITLRQAGPTVTGCYDRSGVLTGTVTGNLVRATGVDSDDKTKSIFILSVVGNDIRGVRSTNGGPFRLWTGPEAAVGAAGPRCADPSQPALGCGSIIHGITFDLDSAVIRPESAPVLAELFKALSADRSTTIVIEGHTSSEGTDTYNLGLSERRAQAVVADLTRRGLPASRMRAAGAGEVRPIASNNDENGRSMNRRVEVQCR